MYVTPQTEDGWLVAIGVADAHGYPVTARFAMPPAFRALTAGRETALVFAARSRLARLGIDLQPLAPPVFVGDRAELRLRVVAAIRSYGIASHLERILVPGLRVGRLVCCPDDSRLDSGAIHQLIQSNGLQVPAGFSLDSRGYLILRPQSRIFRFAKPLTDAEVIAIATHADGKDLLNRLQRSVPVTHLELPPADGLVTACSMFLHRHYVVLRNLDETLGFHLQATVLDPVTTRGTNVYLEFVNRSTQLIVNPSVAASVHEAIRREPRSGGWHGRAVPPSPPPAAPGDPDPEYLALRALFDRLEGDTGQARYSHRLMAVSGDPAALLDGAAPEFQWTHPPTPPDPRQGTELASGLIAEGLRLDRSAACGNEVLDPVADGARATLLLGYFPNLVEHTAICAAALRHRIERIVFRRASFEHGPFLSTRDHGRLADYEGLGLQVFWCNDARGHLVRHVFRGLRGYFTPPARIDRFRSSLVFAFYGSTLPLDAAAVDRIRRLLEHLRALFGGDIAILTGGGPGAMQQVTDQAHALGLMVGSSFIETVDQPTNQTADFYQTFQARSRQSRQRWFEIASFHLFLVGGVGTLEEIGLTLTDMKLGVIESGPIVFFDGSGDASYWEGLRLQLAEMARQGRVPAWLPEQLLLTGDPDAVPRFYRQRLQLG